MATKNSKRFRPQVENLEARLLLHGGAHGEPPTPGGGGAGSAPALIADQVVEVRHPLADIQFPELQRTFDAAAGLPILNSNPGAGVTLHLDFTGHFEQTWFWINGDGSHTEFHDVLTPAFDLDGESDSFNAAEQAVILEVWQRVSEDFAPFNINVTTAYYGPFEDGVALKVAIGGSNDDWLNDDISGISGIGSFSSEAPNVVYAFSEEINLWSDNDDGREYDFEAGLATTASHEAGHSFGLFHQQEYGPNGNIVTDYSEGTATWTPIMGHNLSDDRTTWANGTVDKDDDGNFITQDELAVLTGADNGFGYRPDDHGNTRATASAFSYNLFSTASATGIIEKMDDVDVFSFYTAGGNIRVGVNVVDVGPNLDAKIELRDSKGRLLAQADRRDELGATIQRTVTAGTYYLHVMSHGTYGDLGQYTAYRTLNVPKDPLSGIREVSLNILGPTLGASNGLPAGNGAGIVAPTLPPPPSPVGPVSVNTVVPTTTGSGGPSVKETRISTPTLPVAKPSITEATSRSVVAPRSVKTVASTSAIDHVFAKGLDKLGKLF